MLDNIRKVPVFYVPGTELNSEYSQCITGSEYLDRYKVGGKITIPEHMEKIIVSENLNGVILERYFLQTPSLSFREAYPIYVKIYDPSVAQVLLYASGISHLKQDLGAPDNQGRFLKMRLLASALSELSMMDNIAYEAAYDWFCINQGDNNARIGNEQLAMPLGIRTAVNLGPQAGLFTDARILQEAYAQQNGYGHSDYFVNELIERTRPDLPAAYENMAYDDLTHASMYEPVIDSRDIVANTSAVHNCFQPSIGSFGAESGFVKVTEFTPQLMSLCEILHGIPFLEWEFTYILLSKMHQGVIKISHAHNPGGGEPYKYPIEALEDKLKVQLDNLLGSSDYRRLEAAKNVNDELLLIFEKIDGSKEKYYIDLTMTAVLTQGLTHDE